MPTLTKPEWEDQGGGVKRRITADGEMLMQVEVHFQPGAEGYMHNHPHEQTTYVVYGGGTYTIVDKKYEMKAGDVILVPSGLMHGFLAMKGEETLLLDSFSPPRKDFRSPKG
ncbi:MAG TPA: cupin domain-containing protein [Rhodocyclaceae bacterium]|nr:cupin domain-containing protein [Rhodocyclaceae bacterium]